MGSPVAAQAKYCEWCAGWPCERLYLHNLRQYWKEHLVHVLTGAGAGALLTSDYHWAGIAIMGTVWVRQGLEFQKRKDTPGIDLAYHLGGLVVGTILSIGIESSRGGV